MKTLLIDTVSNTAEEYNVFPEAYPSYWQQHKVPFTVLIPLQIDKVHCFAMCDYSAHLEHDPHISVVTSNGEVLVCGDFMLFHLSDGPATKNELNKTLPYDANLVPLTDSELEVVKSHLKKIPTKLHPEGLMMIYGAEIPPRERFDSQCLPFILNDELNIMNTKEAAKELKGEEVMDYGRGAWEI